MKKVDDIRKALARARAEEIVLRRRWTARTQDCLARVGEHCGGSEERVASMGYRMAGQRLPATLPAETVTKPACASRRAAGEDPTTPATCAG